MADEPSDGSEKDRSGPTVRDLKRGRAVSSDTIPEVIGQYAPPRPPPEATHHRTIDIKPVRLSAEADPRQFRTERRLMSPARPERRRSAMWLVGGLLILIALGAWALLQKLSSVRLVAPDTPMSPATVKASAASLPLTTPIAPTASLAAPALNRSAEALASASSVPAPPAALASPKASGARENAKKRKGPWLE